MGRGARDRRRRAFRQMWRRRCGNRALHVVERAELRCLGARAARRADRPGRAGYRSRRAQDGGAGIHSRRRGRSSAPTGAGHRAARAAARARRTPGSGGAAAPVLSRSGSRSTRIVTSEPMNAAAMPPANTNSPHPIGASTFWLDLICGPIASSASAPTAGKRRDRERGLREPLAAVGDAQRRAGHEQREHRREADRAELAVAGDRECRDRARATDTRRRRRCCSLRRRAGRCGRPSR